MTSFCSWIDRTAAFAGVALLFGVAANTRAATVTPDPVVRGTVQDSAAHPLANVQVVVTPLNRTTTTDSHGHFFIGALPAGTYHVSTLLIGYAPGRADVTVGARAADLDVTIIMRPSALRLAGVQVTATPLATDPREVPQATVQLSGQALERQMGSTLAQTLGSQPGIAIRFDGPAATGPIIRGLQGERVLVLEDGNRAADLTSAAPDHGTSVDPLAAERIEVVRGPASLLYGSSALGGVVNVISNDIPTSIPSRIAGSVAMNAESVTPGGAGAVSVTLPIGTSFALVAKGGGRHSDDLRMGGGETLSNTFFRNSYGVGGIGYSGSTLSGGVAVRDYQFRYGLPSGEGERSMIDGHRREVSGRSELAVNSGALTSVRVSGTAQWYSHAEINEDNGVTNTSFDLKTQTVDVLGRTQIGPLQGALGISGLFKEYGARGEEALTPAANSSAVGAMLFQELPLGDTRDNAHALVPKLQLGGRYDLYRIDIRPSDDPKFQSFVGVRTFRETSGSVGVSVPLNPALTFAASAARAFRAPSVEELSSNAFHGGTGTFDVGNPQLKAEVNQGFEGVLRLETSRLTGQGSAFWNDVQNFVTPNIVKDTVVVTDQGPTPLPLNRISQGDARLHGVEGEIEAELTPHFVLGAMGDVVRGEFTAIKKPLPFMPAARLGGLIRWNGGPLSAQGEFRHAFAQSRVPPAVSADDASGIATSSYNLLNLSVGWVVNAGGRTHSIMTRVDNMLDAKYVDATSRLKSFAFNPGRNMSILYRILF